MKARRCISNKLYPNCASALFDLKDNAVVLFGGFGLCGYFKIHYLYLLFCITIGIPENLIRAIDNSSIKNITAVSNDVGTESCGLGLLVKSKKINKLIVSFIGDNPLISPLVLAKELKVDFVPQGTLAEKLRCGGAGIPGK